MTCHAGLSPFSSEAIAFLDSTGCNYKQIELGPEWFLLDGVGSNVRAELLKRTGQSSLPHVFIGGESSASAAGSNSDPRFKARALRPAVSPR